jgi:hypothetical protein
MTCTYLTHADVSRRLRKQWRQPFAAIALLLAGCGPTINGIPVQCPPRMDEADCRSRAETGLSSLAEDHPPVTRINVTCDVAVCTQNEGAGRVFVTFADGMTETIQIGFGHT